MLRHVQTNVRASSKKRRIGPNRRRGRCFLPGDRCQGASWRTSLIPEGAHIPAWVWDRANQPLESGSSAGRLPSEKAVFQSPMKNESVPDSIESRNARSNSPPPKSAQSQASLSCRHAEWLRSASGNGVQKEPILSASSTGQRR